MFASTDAELLEDVPEVLLSPLDEIIAQVGADRLLAAGGGWREASPPGPDREELLKAVAA